MLYSYCILQNGYQPELASDVISDQNVGIAQRNINSTRLRVIKIALMTMTEYRHVSSHEPTNKAQ